MTTTPNKVERELHSLEPSAIIELFQLHLTATVNGVDQVYYFHAGTNQTQDSIIFDDLAYAAVPIEVDGFEVTTKGTLPRPSMKISNVSAISTSGTDPIVNYGTITALLNAYNPLRAEVRRIRTCKKFLDSANFPTLFFVTQTDDQLITQSGDSLFSGEGLNPTADPTAVFNGGYESWYIDRVATENLQVVEFELVGKLDLTNLRLPARQVVEHCPWIYKGHECGYVPKEGRTFDLNNDPTDWNEELQDSVNDQCAKNLRACELRFPKGDPCGTGPDGKLLPFGGFPGARLQV